jgi:hypothetical protein
LLGEVEGQKKLEAPKVRPDTDMLQRRLVDFGPARLREALTDEDGTPWSPKWQREVRRRQAVRFSSARFDLMRNTSRLPPMVCGFGT